MFCALLGHTGERLQDHWSSGYNDFICVRRLLRAFSIAVYPVRISLIYRWLGKLKLMAICEVSSI